MDGYNLSVILLFQDTLALQKQSKEKRSFANNIDKINNWVSQEFSTIINTLEAECTLDSLIADRCMVAKELAKLQVLFIKT